MSAGLQRTDVRPCRICGKGVAHTNGLTFFRVTVERMCIDRRSVLAHHGLEAITGSPSIAAALAPDSEIAKAIGAPVVTLICDSCAMRPAVHIAELYERDDSEDGAPA